MSWLDQSKYSIKFEWGLEGAKNLAPVSDVCIVVDILSFSTCVDIAISNGAKVLPYAYKDDSAVHYAKSNNAILASPTRSRNTPSLSAASLRLLNEGEKVVLPSPNGSTISFALQGCIVLCGSLRNAKSVAQLALKLGKNISVIAAGEKWPSGSLRPSIEDLMGAGAILSHLDGTFSPEAVIARQTFENNQIHLTDFILRSCSGQELIEREFAEDIQLATELNSSQSKPILNGQYFEDYR